MTRPRNADRRNLWGWILIAGLLSAFAWMCKGRFHMVHPGAYLLLSFAASVVLVLAMWRLYAGTMTVDEDAEEPVTNSDV
jgi:hypothetical protein